jgi:hypothetical protein
MISRPIKAKFLVLSVFFIGVVTGVFLVNFYETRVLGEEIEDANATVNASPTDTGQAAPQQPAVRNDGRQPGERRRPSIAREVQRFHDYVGLDDEQRVQIEAILEQTRGEFRKLSASTRSQYDVIREESRNQIRAILTSDEQRRKYEELVERFNRRLARRRDRN